MKKRDRIDLLLQLAFLEGAITTRGLYEQVAARKKPVVGASSSARASLVELLGLALARSRREEVSLTVGMFLQKARAENSLHPHEVSTRLGLTANIYKMLERDRVSPLKIPVDSWKKLRRLFKVSTEGLIEMIRRTHQLVLFEPSFRTALARYDARKNKAMKPSTMKTAARELYSKAKLRIPVEEKNKLSALFKALSENE